jgi:hypothetical protein
MTSELRVDNLKGSTTGGSINVLGEGTSATTNLQQGLTKVFCNFNGTGTIATRDSFNEASLTDSAKGVHRINLTNAMNSASYVTNVDANYIDDSDGTGTVCNPDRGNNTTTVVYIETRNAAGTADADREHILVAVHGDLA